ncbi:MAG: hypothetical protein WDZ60_06140, partial [Wenzhouxiangellaceae bacterium]
TAAACKAHFWLLFLQSKKSLACKRATRGEMVSEVEFENKTTHRQMIRSERSGNSREIPDRAFARPE